MIIFVDESGIHNQIDHSTFSLVYIATQNREEVEKSVVNIEQELRIEFFHWSDRPWKIREEFFKRIVKLPFSAKIAIFKNPIRPSNALEWALEHLLVERDISTLLIDGKKPRWIERSFKKALRDKGISLKKFRTVRQESSPGIRLADALAGLSRSYYDNPEGKAAPLWKIMQKKITTRILGGQVDG